MQIIGIPTKRGRLARLRWLAVGCILLVAVLGFVDRILPRILADEVPVADHIVVEKGNRRLLLLNNGRLIKTYSVELGRVPIGAKEREGDRRTPEGDYVIDYRNARSRFYKSLHISYPAEVDKARAATAGYDAGSDIMIHGRTNWLGAFEVYFSGRDWTLGCISVSNADMEELWKAIPDGTPITILP